MATQRGAEPRRWVERQGQSFRKGQPQAASQQQDGKEKQEGGQPAQQFLRQDERHEEQADIRKDCKRS